MNYEEKQKQQKIYVYLYILRVDDQLFPKFDSHWEREWLKVSITMALSNNDDTRSKYQFRY